MPLSSPLRACVSNSAAARHRLPRPPARMHSAGCTGGRGTVESGVQIESIQLEPGEGIPNNPDLPVVLYRRAVAVAAGEDAARELEELFRAHGWPPQWRNGVYNFHHYHSTAHEVLGFAAGHARLLLGGPGGREVTVQAGDAVLLPAGTGHCALEKSADFLVIGAYPLGQDWEVERSPATEATRQRIAAVPRAERDPVTGSR